METRTENPIGAIKTDPAPSPAPAPSRRLHLAVLRLVAVLILFAGWMAYLAYLVVTMPKDSRGDALILSRSQFLVSAVDVIARVDGTDPDAPVTVEVVLYPTANAPVKAGDKIHVANLAACKRPAIPPEKPAEVPADWTGPGSYLLPLTHIEGDKYFVTPTPPSPGYPPSGPVGPPRIYPATEAAKAEYRAVTKGK